MNDNTRNRFQVILPNGTDDFISGKKIVEFEEQKSFLYTSLLSDAPFDRGALLHKNPVDREDAEKRADWPQYFEAEQEELRRFKDLKYMINLCKDRPEGVFVHKMKVIYQRSLSAEGYLIKHKVRFILCGYSMIADRDFKDPFAPVPQLISQDYVLSYFEIRFGDVRGGRIFSLSKSSSRYSDLGCVA